MSFENLILYLETNDSGDQYVEGFPTLPSNYPAPAGVLPASSTLTLPTWMLHQIPYIKGSVLQDCTLLPFQIQLTDPGGPLSF